ncbi:hypothetical protein DFJ77DRAFT_528235 [Powellomyces hirtus]|nr:hypothetical protein DFJ77DRAFT_528235 [Powellomyces hirtus]
MDVDRNNSPSPDTTTTTTTAKRRNNQQLQKAAAKKVQLAGEPTVHYDSTPEVVAATSICWKCRLHKGGKMFLGECHHMICRPCIVALANATDTGPLGQFVCGVDRLRLIAQRSRRLAQRDMLPSSLRPSCNDAGISPSKPLAAVLSGVLPEPFFLLEISAFPVLYRKCRGLAEFDVASSILRKGGLQSSSVMQMTM